MCVFCVVQVFVNLIYEKPHGWSSLFDLSELLMPSLDEQLDLPAHGRGLMLHRGNEKRAIYSTKPFDAPLGQWSDVVLGWPARLKPLFTIDVNHSSMLTLQELYCDSTRLKHLVC